MEYIPPPTSPRRSLAYILLAVLVELVIGLFLGPKWSLAWDAAIMAMTGGVFVYAFLRIRGLNEYGFDERGVYRRGRQLFLWSQVKRLGLKFGESGGSVTLVAQPRWGAVLSGPLVERETWVSYGVRLVFDLETGGEVPIPSNLDRLLGKKVERIDELARLANPRIEFT
jgi:hypothetical protein